MNAQPSEAGDLDREEGNGKAESSPEPSLGPACLVISILALAAMSAFCAFGSYWVFSDQYPLAAKAIDKQLIPWVESSQLSAADKESILTQLQDLLPLIENRQIDKEQLLRLRNCLQDNPVLLWGCLQSLHQQAQSLGMNEAERIALQRIDDRLLKMATDRLLSRNNLEYTLQGVAKVRENGQSIEVLDDVTIEQIREFMKRAENLLETNQVPNQDYDKTPGEAFGILVDAALQRQPDELD